jgi:predicted DNA-binding protein with PD1-like motif
MEFIESKPGKLVFARLVEGEDLLETVTKVAENAKVPVGLFFLIGTLKKAKLGFFREGEYETTQMDQPLEIVSCLGNISIKENKTFAHAHISVSDEKGRVFGGHVMSGCLIGVTGELVLMEAEGVKISRKFDESIKLYLWSMGKSTSV